MSLTKEQNRMMATPSGFAKVMLGMDPHDWQVSVMDAMLPAHTKVALRTCNESGKPQPSDMVVPTPFGMKRFGDLVVGDWLFNRHGGPCKVTAVFEKGMRDIYEILLDGGEVSTLATGDHLWWYMPMKNRANAGKRWSTFGKWEVWSTEQMLSEQGENSIPIKRGYIPACDPVEFAYSSHQIHPYIIGALIGDGGLTGASVMISSADQEILDRISELLPEGYELKHSSRYDWRINGGKKSILKSELKHMGLMGKGSHGKFIPSTYLIDSVENRTELLRGLMDTDGTCGGKCNVEFCTVSERLASDVAFLVRSLGGKAKIKCRTTPYEYRDGRAGGCLNYRVAVKSPQINPFFLERKATLWYEIGVRKDRLVYGIKPAGEADCRCIMVDSKDNSYLANDFIVTHNTTICIAALILWHMECFPGCMVVTTSASNKQIGFQLYPALELLRKKLGPGWKIRNSTNEHSVKSPHGSVCISYSTDDELKSEGFHVRAVDEFMANWTPPKEWKMKNWTSRTKAPLLMIMDECKGIKDARFDAYDRCRPIRILYASSPGNPIGRFYDLFHRFAPMFKKKDGTLNLFHATAYDCPHIVEDPQQWNQIQLQIDIRGEKDAWVQSSVFGEFAEAGHNMVFDLFKVDQSMSGTIRQYDESTLRAAVDLSGGGDEQVLYNRRGNKAELVGTWRMRDYYDLTAQLTKEFDKLELRPHWIRADRGGLGDPICDMMAKAGWDVERMDFGGRPKNPKKYLNVRSEMFFELAQNIAQGHIILPRDDELREQLGWQKYNMDEQQRIVLIPKKQMPRSPDRADTIAMLFYGMTSVNEIMNDHEMRRRMLSPTLPTKARSQFDMAEEEEEEALFY